ncbi:AbrB/MazE/SpoVT family DNA-binding domain-containing protein [Candidatus Woesearchaeota archaeon]|nr:AbrB/MazE/SpoVT family DNA-binding domain-containing protein [Candidatus Woesearchaeota archaeon]
MKFSRPKEAGTRLKQNYIKLRETKLSQYNVTLPKGIVEAMNFSKGDVFKVYIENGHIVLKKEFIAPKYLKENKLNKEDEDSGNGKQ